VDKQLFPVNALDLNGKEVLVQLEVADKDKGKGSLISDPRVPDESKETISRQVVAEKTPDEGETLKITIISSNTRGHVQKEGRINAPVLRITDGPTSLGGRSGIDQRQQRTRTLKLRRSEIGMWKQNAAKTPGRLIKVSPTFDLLMSKYVNKRVSRHDWPKKRPRSPGQEKPAKAIGPFHQAKPNKSAPDVV
jgi:hypothetical protein